ncbi:MAG: NAD-binding protein [Bacillota bacterium]
MEVIAMVSIIVLMISGYFIMDIIDDFFVRNSWAADEFPVDRRSALIFTDPCSEEIICELFDKLKFSYYVTEDSFIPENLDFATFFAISSDDGENLFMSRLVKRRSKDVRIVARVNDYIYVDLYHKLGIDKVITGGITPDSIAISLKEVSPHD